MISPLILLLLSSFQGAADPGTHSAAISTDERVKLEATLISDAVIEYAESKESKLKKYVSKDGRIRIYSDSRSKEAKQIFKLSEAMLEKLDSTLGVFQTPEGESEQLLGFVINKANTYWALCDVVAEAAHSQANFMESSKDTTGFTIFAPELTVYYHDANYQEEGRIDHSIAHNLVHLEIERRYGELPLWLREGIATALEDMVTGEVWGPWYRNGFVYTASHGDWRGIQTRKQIERLKSLRTIFAYSAKPYQDHAAHEGFAFAVYCLLEEPESLAKMMIDMQDLYPETNPKGGRSLLTVDQTDELFEANFEAGFMERFQTWWLEPPRWNAKVKKSKKKKKR